MESIVVNVDDTSGMAYRRFSPESKKQFNFAVNIMLKKIVNARNITNYRQLLDDIGIEAKENGLTPGILDELLKDNND